MNNAWNKFKANRDRGSKTKNLVISIVILIEVIAVMVVGSFAWVETISSIKIKNFDEGTVNSYLYNIAQIGDSATEILPTILDRAAICILLLRPAQTV